MGTVLVTGGAGFIGSSLAEELLRQGETVRVLDDFSSGRRSNLEGLTGKLELIEGTILDPDTVARAMKGAEVVFHEAAIPSVARSVDAPQASMLANVQGTTVVLDVARHSGVRRLVFAASSSAYGNTKTLPKVETMTPDPLSPYAISKLTCEHLLRVFSSLYGIETLSLRYFNVFGPRQDPEGAYAAVIPHWVAAMLRGEPVFINGDGETSRDFCFVANAVQANLLAATVADPAAVNQVYNVAAGDRTTLRELFFMLRDLLAARRPGLAALAPVYREFRPGDVRHSQADIAKAARLLGYAPSHRVAEGLREAMGWYVKALAAPPAA